MLAAQTRRIVSLALVLAVLWSDVDAAVVGAGVLKGVGRQLNADHDRVIEASRQLALVEANRQRAETQGAFLACPEGLVPCRVGRGDESDLNDDNTGADVYECVNTNREATQCGGCVLGRDNEGASIRGPGKDCTAGIGIKAATCRRGSCSVASCRRGYTLGDDHNCVKTAKAAKKH